MEEIWKDIEGFEGLYKVNEYGEIFSFYTNKILKYSISNDGYKQYNLHKNKKAYIMTAHKAVAKAFIPNPNNFPLINHKDEDKRNCYYDNLEWCDYKYNNSYNNKQEKISKKQLNDYGKEFYLYDINLNFLGKFKGTRKFARENNLSSGNFSTCLNKNNNGKNKYRCRNYIPCLTPLI